jgi:gamma-glutamyl phosphate reductase
MTWEIIAMIVAREGIEVAAKLVRNALDKAPVTVEAIDALLASRKTAAQIREEVRQSLPGAKP